MSTVTLSSRAYHTHWNHSSSTVDVTPASAQQLVDALIDPAGQATVSNILFTGSGQCAGTFTDGQLSVNLPSFPNEGLVLSSGLPSSLAFQESDFRSFEHGTPGDPDLTTIAGFETFDACVLQFDVQCPPGQNGPAMIEFEYVFGSDEYKEFTFSEFNDAFALFLNGANIALLPDGTTTVSINNVNNETNSEFFVDNDALENLADFGIPRDIPFPLFEADGFTTTLTAMGPVSADTTNTIKLAIADVFDTLLDSWVLLKAASFRCTNIMHDDKDGGVGGDPHFKTWSGRRYDYHGACDLVLLQNPSFNQNQGMDIHIRSKHIHELSYVSNAAIRIGDDVLEVNSDVYYVNGEANVELPVALGGFKVTHKVVNEHQQTFLIHLEQETIVIKTWRQFVSIKFEHARADTYGDSVGLMGTFGDGVMLARDGITVMETDVNAFGAEWQVRSWEAQLFHDAPQHGEQCSIVQKSVRRRRLGEVSEDQAAIACARVPLDDRGACIFDVLATNDIGMAGAY